MVPWHRKRQRGITKQREDTAMRSTHNSVERAGRAALATLVACALAAPAAVLAAPGEAHAAPKISAKSKTLAAGKSFALKVKGEKGKIKWSSTNRKVATVTSKGKVTARKMGTAKIRAKVGKRTYTCKVKVNPRISASRKTVAAGKSFALKLAGASGKVKWSSTNKKVVTVTSKGKVKAKKAGTATVTARIGGKKVASCKVTVRKGASAHVHSWKKVLVREAWEEEIPGEYYYQCACGKQFDTGSEWSAHNEQMLLDFADATTGMSKEEADKLAATLPKHNGASKRKPSEIIHHPAEYAYKCNCGAVK